MFHIKVVHASSLVAKFSVNRASQKSADFYNEMPCTSLDLWILSTEVLFDFKNYIQNKESNEIQGVPL